MADQPQPATRPYRSKRNRPCDLCRTRKVYCHVAESPPCILCQKLDVDCTFVDRPSKRRQADFTNHAPTTSHAEPHMPEYSNDDRQFEPSHESFHPSQLSGLQQGTGLCITDSSAVQGALESHNDTQQLTVGHGDSDSLFNLDSMSMENLLDFHDIASQNSMPPEDTSSQVLPQQAMYDTQRQAMVSETGIPPAINSIDGKDGSHAEYFGLSGETDPFLLRHYRYDDGGEFRMFKLVYRQTANDLYNNIPRNSSLAHSPLSGSLGIDAAVTGSHQTSDVRSDAPLPVHFMMAADELADDAKEDTTIRADVSPESIRVELNDLVLPEDGTRLVGLFLKYVFPSLPVVSRFQLDIDFSSPFPTTSSLSKVPTHLLAAMYASSVAFWADDDLLCVSKAYKQPSTSRLWRIVFEEILREIHTPRLSVLQACLLYLQKPRAAALNSAAADTPFKWSFLAFTVGLTTSLGLHLECRDWSIPAWEKRLRKRLWWTVYSEEKWRSLLHGQPALISLDQWNVSDLREEDFLIQRRPFGYDGSAGMISSQTDKEKAIESGLHFRNLAALAKIADDIYQSFYTLRATQRMSQDFSLSLSTAQPLRHRLRSWYSSLPEILKMRNRSTPVHAGGLESTASLHLAYLTLELLVYRALLRPLGRSNISSNGHDPVFPHGHSSYTIAMGNAQEPPLAFSQDLDPNIDMQAAAEATICAAEHCAQLATEFTGELGSRDFSGYWYSWSRIGFATMSNFVMLLIIQAPNIEHATKAKSIADTWRHTLRSQSKICDLMKLGMLRLDAIYWTGMEKLFIVGPHVRQVL